MDYSACTILKTNTTWALISGSHEVRHTNDIILAVDSLRKIGVPDAQIFIFLDQPEKLIHLNNFGITQNIFATSEMAAQLRLPDGCEHLFVVVTGHGDHLGISTPPGNITPKGLIDTVRSLPNLKAGVIVLGQCFGGVFNFMDAYSSPPLVIMGATNLNPSLSSLITLNPPISNTSTGHSLSQWVANVFLLYFFEWLKNPVDIDGDGQKTIKDAYKYAGVRSNQHLRSIKSFLFFEIDSMTAQQLSLLRHPGFQSDARFLLQSHAIQRKINDAVEQLYLHQEPWVLNANFARVISF